jgi:hypothetical protein
MPALPKEELAKVIPLLEKLRLDLQDASGGNKEPLFSISAISQLGFHMTNAAHQQFVANLRTSSGNSNGDYALSAEGICRYVAQS